MELLKGKVLLDFTLQHRLVRIVDIINFEGPLLSLYENPANGHLFLYDWIDRDEKLNRWLIYYCKPIKIWEYINQKISHYDLFDSKTGVCYIIDINSNLHIDNAVRINRETLPDIYFPEKEAYFESSDCIQYDKLIQFVKSSLQKSENELTEIYAIKKAEHYFWQKYFKPFDYNLHNKLLLGNYMDIKSNLHYNITEKRRKRNENKIEKNITKNINYVSASY